LSAEGTGRRIILSTLNEGVVNVNHLSKRALQINLYCFAVATNIWALLALLYGVVVRRFTTADKVLATALTAASVFAWWLYFHVKRRE
jgi:hypothetical protein